ncbi:MAG: hypothetical protein WD768_08150 [Phycisphaeraceae bacterium]
MSRFLTALRSIVPAFVIVFGFAASVMAQAAEPLDQAPEDNAWKTTAAVILLGGFIIAASIKKSKREHRD